MDSLRREIRTATQGFDGRLVNTDRYHDGAGRLERVSEPHFAGETRYWNLTAYDAMGRIDSLLAADGNDKPLITMNQRLVMAQRSRRTHHEWLGQIQLSFETPSVRRRADDHDAAL
jgi:hypothetical protein